MAELEWILEQIKILEQLVLLASTFKALEPIEQLKGQTCTSLSALEKNSQTIPWDMLIKVTVFLKQTSSLSKHIFIDVTYIFSITSKMSG